MRKRVGLLMALLLSCILPGCWSYTGLNELAFVAGISVDYNSEEDKIKLTLELPEITSSAKEAPTKPVLLETEGKTFLDALRNAEDRTERELNFTTMETVFISPEYAEKKGLFPAIDFFMRNSECRLTIIFAVTDFTPAAEVFSLKLTEGSMLSFDIAKTLNTRQQGIMTASNDQLYETYEKFMSPGSEIILPLISKQKNGEKEIAKASGVAVFRGDRMVGRMSPEDTYYLLFVNNRVTRGTIQMEYKPEGKPPVRVVLEIVDSKTKRKVIQGEDDAFVVHIQTEASFYLNEVDSPMNLLNLSVMEEIKDLAEQELEKRMTEVIKKAQKEHTSDVFMFGNSLYKQDIKTWRAVEAEWDAIYPSLETQIEAKVAIHNSSLTKKSGKE